MTNSTFKIVIGECKRAAQIMDKIMVGSLPWEALFEGHAFFRNYEHFLEIVVSSDNASRQLKWYVVVLLEIVKVINILNCRTGLVESRIRGLLNKLESVNGLALAHPFIEGFDNTYNCTSFDEVDAATRGAGIKTQDSGQGMTVYTRTFYIGLYFKPVPGNSSWVCVCA